MSIREGFRNLWYHLTVGLDEPTPYCEPAPVQPTTPSPAPVPEVSCFVKGIAKSLETEQVLWKRTDIMIRSRDGWYPIPLLDVTHEIHGVRVIAFPISRFRPHQEMLSGCKRITSIHLYERESRQACDILEAGAAMIAQTIEAHPFGEFKGLLDAEERERRGKAAAETHFTRLGCPGQSSTSASS